MLQIDQNKRAKLEDIMNSDWVTDNGTETINFSKIEYDGK